MNDCYGPRFEQSMHIDMSEEGRDRLMYLSLTEIADEQKEMTTALETIAAKYDALVAYRKHHFETGEYPT